MDQDRPAASTSATSAVWRARPVFVSSTFRDMQAERGWLRDHVIPVLAERLRERRHHLEVIDLLWGVETTSATAQEEKELLVLKVCLDEIERSRPFLIVLLGDRYGWVPPEGRMARAAQEAGFQGDLAGKSVTALEIEFGALDSPDQRRRTHFYFRAPLPYAEMPPETAALYSDEHSPEPGARDAHERLEGLKARIKTDPNWAGRWHDYTAAWDAEHEHVTGLQAWGEAVIEHVWADLDEETRAFVHEAPTAWQEQEREAFAEFVAHRQRDFRGRADLVQELQNFALSLVIEGQPWGLSLTGESGSGKSALMAHLYRQLQSPEVLLLSHAAGISVRSAQVDSLLVRWIGELADFLQIPCPLGDNPSADEVQDTFASLLGRAALRRRVVVLLDALNQFEPTTRAQYLTWLPKLWPENARLITTAIPGTASETLEQRPGVQAKALPALSTPEAEEIAEAICDRYHRTLNPAVLQVLVTKQREDGEPASGNPLWLELALEELNLLDEDDFARLGREFQGTAEQQLLQLLLYVANRLPAEIEGLYGEMLDRAGEIWGEAWARDFAELIAISRGGWRELDFQVLLPELTGDDWDPLRFAGLRRAFRTHLVQCGPQEQWDFFHVQTREAVRRKYLQEAAHERALHTALADHLLGLPGDDPLREQEAMFHLIGADDKPRAAEFCADAPLRSSSARTDTLAAHIANTENQEPNPGLEWTLALLDTPELGDATRAALCKRYLWPLYEALESQTRLGTKLLLLQGTQTAQQALCERAPDNTAWQRELSVSHERLGDVRVAKGDLRGALAAYKAALAIGERLAAADPGNAAWQRDLAASYSRLGDVLVAQGDLPGALRAYEASLTIAERLAAADPGNAAGQRDLSVCHEKLGDMRIAQGDLPGALSAYQAALDIAERLATAAPGNAAWQRDLSVSHEKLGDMRVAQGDLPGARLAYEASLTIAERLAAADPGNAARR
ncbi:MAG: DUF4062 domain-containing protein, partial [Armatimonadetes bacterium]|nr:DUF4062 domain-containing protein [Armatimonadota bacterium]